MQRSTVFKFLVIPALIVVVIGITSIIYAYQQPNDNVYRICVDQSGHMRLLFPDANGHFSEECKQNEFMIELPSSQLITMLESELNELWDTVSQQRTTITQHEQRISELESKVSELENRVTLLEGGVPSENITLEGLVLWLPMDEGEGSVANDKSGLGNDASILGAQWVSLNDTYALSFDGTDDIIYISNPSFIDDTSGTVEVWVSFDNVNAQHMYVATCVDGATSHEIQMPLRRDSNNELQFTAYSPGRQPWEVTLNSPDNTITDTGWHHIVFTSDGSKVRCYVDGEERTLTPSVGSNSGQWFGTATNSDTFCVGAIKRASIVAPMAGTMGEVRVYNRALTPQEIQQNYLATEWKYP
ncbi:MAG: LamG domain-containing protein [Dehalococcoidales bacterium]